jgi:hypothetical protein
MFRLKGRILENAFDGKARKVVAAVRSVDQRQKRRQNQDSFDLKDRKVIAAIRSVEQRRK